MAFTLADYSRLAKEPLVKGVIDTFRKDSAILDKMTFETTGTLSTEYIRTKAMPDIHWRDIAEAFTESKGTTESLTEQIHFLGGYIDIPKEYVEAKNQITDQRALQTSMFVRSMSYSFQDKFINGTPSSSPKELVGLWYRLTNDIPGQVIAAAASTGLDVSPDATTLSTQQLQLVDKIIELVHSCEEHTADYLLMNDTMYLRLMAALKGVTGMLTTTKDNYGRMFQALDLGGKPIALVDMGYKADQTTRVMPNTETFAGALTGGAQTSIYAVKFGGEEFLNGFQFKPIMADNVGLLENRTHYRTVIDWGVGIYFVNPRSIARLRGIIAA